MLPLRCERLAAAMFLQAAGFLERIQQSQKRH